MQFNAVERGSTLLATARCSQFAPTWPAGILTASRGGNRVSDHGCGDAVHHLEVGNEPRVLLVDDLRSFVDGRKAEVARTSAAGVELLERYRRERLDELWLDHDLGDDDTIWPVVDVLERAAFDGRPFDIGVVNIHSANPAGVTKMVQALRRWGYRVRIASGSADVGYLDRTDSAE